MAVKNYRWRANTRYQSTTTLSYGVEGDTSWHTTTAETGSDTFTYWFRDANVMVGGEYRDSDSSRVRASVTDSWTVSIDNRNYMTVRLVTTINYIVRDDCVGTNTDTPGRYLDIYREQGGTLVQRFTDNQVATAHPISGPFTLADYTFVLAPGENLSKSSLFLHNEVIGISSWDEIFMGIEFQNILPAESIPGKINFSNDWWSHNRSGGTDKIFNGTSWIEMKNVDGGVGTNDPPLIKWPNEWRNMRTIGRDSGV